MNVSIINEKRGVGKSTAALNIAGVMSAERKKALLIDIDPQCNLSNKLVDNVYENEKSVFHLIMYRKI